MNDAPSNALIDALAERDRILTDLDIDAAKAFIANHGGFVGSDQLDWLRVLHLARLEVQTMPPDLISDSRVYLTMTGARSIGTLPEASPYLRSAIDLVFPRDLTDAYLTGIGVPS